MRWLSSIYGYESNGCYVCASYTDNALMLIRHNSLLKIKKKRNIDPD